RRHTRSDRDWSSDVCSSDLSVFGERYAGATEPLVILLLAGFAIGISGVIGTVIVARRGCTALVVQVAACLVFNIGLGAILIPRFGPMGAAVDTVLTELLAVALLARQVPGLVGHSFVRALGR